MALVVLEIKRGNAFRICALEENGSCILLQFLNTAQERDLDKFLGTIKYIADNGPLKNRERSKLVEDGIFELKTGGGMRVFYFYDAGKMVICTNGYIKKKDRLDPAEITRAKLWRNKYLDAKNSNKLTFKESGL